MNWFSNALNAVGDFIMDNIVDPIVNFFSSTPPVQAPTAPKIPKSPDVPSAPTEAPIQPNDEPEPKYHPPKEPAPSKKSKAEAAKKKADAQKPEKKDNPVSEEGCCPKCKDIIKESDIKIYFSSTSVKSKLSKILEEINKNRSKYGLDTCLQKAHFIAQVSVESGTGLEEGTIYSLSNAKNTFKFYNKNHPHNLEKYTYVTKIKGKRYKKDKSLLTSSDRKQLLEEVYIDKNRSSKTKLGNINDGDGYKFRGRGLKQLTGKYNYKQFQKWNNKEFSEKKDFIANPDLLLTEKYAARSALYFWKENGLDNLAEKGSKPSNVDAITKKINPALKGKQNRRNNFKSYWEKLKCENKK